MVGKSVKFCLFYKYNNKNCPKVGALEQFYTLKKVVLYFVTMK